jgi:hypothetical protein
VVVHVLVIGCLRVVSRIRVLPRNLEAVTEFTSANDSSAAGNF